MAATYEEALRTGGGRIEYVTHIHGLPWAVCTHPSIPAMIDAAMGSLYPAISLRREMFGALHCVVNAAHVYPADYVQIIHGMEAPGEQTVKLSATMGSVETGGFKVEVLDIDYKLTLPHRPENPVFGLDCVHTIPDYRYDDTIRWTVLAADFPKAETTLTVAYDAEVEARLIARFADDLPCYLWIGNECVAAYDYAVVDDTLEIDVLRGVWHSVEQAHYPDDYDGASYPVCDAPFGGAVGKPITIWAILVDEDCTTILDVARGRCGRVSTDIESEDGITEIDCDGWTDWLRAPIKQRPFQAPIKGYEISMPVATDLECDYAPHLSLEFGAGIVLLNFCLPGECLYFDTYDELAQHVSDELDLLAVGAGTYNPGPIANAVFFDGTKTRLCCDVDCWIGGVLPWAFRWGCYTSVGDVKAQVIDKLVAGDWTQVTSLNALASGMSTAMLTWQDSGATVPADVGYTGWTMDYPTVPYFYQWPWNNEPCALAFDEATGSVYHKDVLRRRWPIPNRDLTATSDIVLDDGISHERFAAGVNIDCNCPMEGSVGRCDGTAVNYLEFGIGGGLYSQDDPALPALKLRNGKKIHKGHCLCPVYGDVEPVVGALSLLGQVRINPAIDPWWILAELCGNDIAGVYCSERYQLDQIPDADWGLLTLGTTPGLPSDQMPTIDWKTINGVFAPITSGEWYAVNFKEKSELLLSAIMEGFLLAHGVAPTWEFDASWKMWRMRFRPFATPNSTEAHLWSRELTQGNLQRHGYAVNHVLENLYNRIDYKGSWNGESHRVTVNTVGQSAYASTGGRSATLTINDYITQQPPNGTLVEDYVLQMQIQSLYGASILPRVAQPAPSIKVYALPSTGTILGVGVPVLVDDATLRDPHTNQLGISNRSGVIMETRIKLYGDRNQTVLRFFASDARGYVPSLQIKNGDETGTDPDVVHFGGAATDPANNVFGCEYWPLTDLAYFDCYRIIGGAVTLDIGCTCDPYRVMLIERYTDTPAVHRDLQITNIDLAAGTFDLVGAGLDAAFVAGEYVLLYEAWDNADLQPCQRRWLYHADEDKLLIDSAAVETKGKGWI